MDERARYRRGLTVRRAVLGAPHVKRALAARGELDEAFQDLITRYAWGEMWTRPGLSRSARSLVTLAMLVALKSPELRLHLRAASRCGVSRDQVREVLLHAAIYCGVPAAHSALQLAAEVFAEMDAEKARPGGGKRGGRRRTSP